jgi:BON domain
MMKDKSRVLGVITMLAAVVALSACNKAPAPTDAQVATEVQNKVSQDSRIGSHEIGVQTDHGIVTLSGNVDSEVERTSAASDAATVHGVKTVVNNLAVQQAQSSTGGMPPQASTPAPASSRKKLAKSQADLDKDYGPGAAKSGDSSNGAPSTQPVAAPAPAVAQAPPLPSPPKKVAVPAGTQLTVRLNDALDTERNQVGDTFHATLGAPIMINDETVIPSGADVVGHVVDLKSAGRFAGNSALTLELTSVSVNGKTYNIQTNQWSRQGKGEGKNTAIKAGGGAALGAIIGGLAGGGKGAGIGSVAGAGAGTGVAATKKGEQIKLAPEATLSFLLTNTVTVTEQASNNRNAGRTPLQ